MIQDSRPHLTCNKIPSFIHNAILSPVVHLIDPFPAEHIDKAFEWMHEYPERSLDDSMPKTKREFQAMMERRGEEEYTYCVMQDGEPVGFIGFAFTGPITGSMRGVCFTKSVHGNGTAVRAMRGVLQQHFDYSGMHKISAFPFADNHRAIAFYKKLGAKTEGVLRQHSKRDGKFVDIVMLSFFAQDDGYRMGDW